MLYPVTFIYNSESGPLTVTANGSDYAAYEDTFDRVTVTDVIAGRYKTLVWLLWHAMTRQSLTTETFEAFLDTTPEFESPKVEDPVPLESQAPTGE